MAHLEYDAQGFIKGIKDTAQLIHHDTQAILALLKGWHDDTKRAQKQGAPKAQTKQSQKAQKVQATPAKNAPQSAKNDTKSAVKNSTKNAPKLNTGNTVLAKKQRTKTNNAAIDSAKERTDKPSTQENSKTLPQRDAKGRFSAKADESAFVKKLGVELGKNMNLGSANTDHLDPIIDSAKELSSVLAPALRLGGATINVVKQYRAKRREPLPIAQERHNRKLLEILAKIAQKQQDGGLLGKLGLSFGGFGKKFPKTPKTPKTPKGGVLKSLLKGGGRALGAVGSLLGLGFLASEWGELDGKEKSAGVGGLLGSAGGAWAGATAGASIGATVGSVVPVIGTAAGGAVGGVVGAVAGGVAGNTAGEYLGRKAYPQLKAFGTQMTEYGLPQKLQSGFLGGLSPLFIGTTKIVRMMAQGIKGMMAKGSAMLGGLEGGFGAGGFGAGGMAGAPTEQAMQAADYASMNAAATSLGKCARYVNNAMRSVGFKVWGDGYQVADNLYNLNPGKFDKFTWTPDYVPQIGDVMSMPSHSKSEHKHGHVAIYTKDGWVSDYKQGHKYGNSGAANSNYDAELRSGRIKGTIVRQKGSGYVGAGGSFGGGGAGAGAGVSLARTNNSQYDHLIMQSSRKHGVDPAFIKSIINTESAFRTNATSSAGAMGLMQLMPGTAKGLGVNNAYDPAQNIEGGTKYVAWLMKKYQGDKQKVLAAYNWGHGNLDKHIKTHGANWINTLPKESRGHIQKTLSNLPSYGGVGANIAGANTVYAPAPATPSASTRQKSANPLPAVKKSQPAAMPPIKANGGGYKDKQVQIFNQATNNLSQNIADDRLAHTVTGGVGFFGGMMR